MRHRAHPGNRGPAGAGLPKEEEYFVELRLPALGPDRQENAMALDALTAP